ncbi:hypothetical protein FALCPG4_015284 [Fusarium falciforme]
MVDPSHERQRQPEILEKTDNLCERIEDLYSEWNIGQDDWFRSRNRDPKESWMVAEVVLLGLMSMICMLRHATALVRGATELEDVDVEVARKPLAQKISRRMLKTTSFFLDRHPEMGCLSTFFGFLRMDLPYTYLARNILQAPDPCPWKDYKILLNSIAQAIGAMSREDEELKPLAWAAYRLNLEIETKACSTPAGDRVSGTGIRSD